MPWWMKFYVRKPIEGDGDDLAGGTAGALDGGGGGGGSVDGGGAADDDASGGDDSGSDGAGAGGDGKGERKSGADLTKGMLDAIKTGLAEGGEGTATADAAGAKPKAGTPDAKGGAKAGEADAGKPAGADGIKPDDVKKQVKAADFQLTAEDKKTLSPKSVGRFHELHKYATSVEAERDQFREQNAQLSQARETILGALKDSHTDTEDLAQLLNFNYLIKTGDFDAALQIIDGYRTGLLKHLGREGAGFDPLTLHPDLLEQVQQEKTTRENALQVAQARAAQQRDAQARETQAQQQQREQAAQREQDSALQAIAQWNQRIATSDPAYSKKAAMLEPRLKDIMSRYAPQYWAAAIEDAYNGIQVQAEERPAQHARQPGGQLPGTDEPLRPRSGKRPGAAAAGSMLQALQQGLGYEVTQ